jgi:hypothetical protein
MSRLDEFVAPGHAAFERVHRDVSLGDPVANARLTVDVVDAATVYDTPALVLVTPWTGNGLVFLDGDSPESQELAGRRRTVFRVDVAGVGAFRSVNLPVEAAASRSTVQARTLARSWISPLHLAVHTVRAARAQDDRSDAPSPAVAESGGRVRW